MTKLTRGDFLKRGAAAVGALSAAGQASAAPAKFDGTIRVAGLGYDLLPPIQRRAKQELGLTIVGESEYETTVERWARQTPGNFDIFSLFNDQIDGLWPAGSFRPLEIARIERWREINPLLRLGKVRPGDPRCTYGQGDAAFRRLYLDPDRSGRWKSPQGTPRELDGLIVQWADEASGQPVGPEPQFCTAMPHAFNFDSLGYNAHVIRKAPEQVSWAELFNPRWRGRVALTDGTEVGLLDAANAARAAGLLRIADLGRPTRGEIDRLIKLLFVLKRRGQFFGVWSFFPDAVAWMRSGDVVIQSMFALQIEPLAALGFPVRQAAPPEGYRAFAGLLAISSGVTDRARLDACYRYLDWWQSGFAGSVLLRQGYYNPVQATSRRFMAPGEYAYWIDGEPADRRYSDPFGDVSVRKGQVRDGGSFARRACRISVWNTKASAYLDERYGEFVASFRQP